VRGEWALSQITENRKVEARKPLIFQDTVFEFSLEKATLRQSRQACRPGADRGRRPGVALSYKGRWPKHERTYANVNVLNPGTKTDMGESTSVHGVEVTVTPVKP
jgi:hypothetical protein